MTSTFKENESSKEDEEEINSKKWEYYSINCKEEEITCGHKKDENTFNLEIVQPNLKEKVMSTMEEKSGKT